MDEVSGVVVDLRAVSLVQRNPPDVVVLAPACGVQLGAG